MQSFLRSFINPRYTVAEENYVSSTCLKKTVNLDFKTREIVLLYLHSVYKYVDL